MSCTRIKFERLAAIEWHFEGGVYGTAVGRADPKEGELNRRRACVKTWVRV